MSKDLDLLFVNVGGTRKKIYQDLSSDYSAIEPPFWAALTASYMQKKDYSVDILDANAENLDFDETVRTIEERSPRLINIVGYGQHPSASTALMTGIGELSRKINDANLDSKVVLTGIHASALPGKTLREEAVDYVSVGEGFHTLEGLLEGASLNTIPGLWYRDGDVISNGPPAKLIKNLPAELNDVAWDLLPMDKYKAHNWHVLDDLDSRLNYAALSTTLGCPFGCSFCCINAPFGGPSYRSWDADWTLKQIDTLVKKYDVKNLKLIDEIFVLKPSHFMPIVDGLIERDYGLNIWTYARVDTTKEEHLDKFKKAGINWLALGIESGDNEVRGKVSKGRFKKEEIYRVVGEIKNHGINVGGNYIFGLPDDDMGSMGKTLEMAKELNCEWANFYSAMAYPGSKLHTESVANKVPLPEDFKDIGWQGYSQHSYNSLPLSTDHLSSKEVLQFRDNAFDEYFTSERYLGMIGEKFGSRAREHLEGMTGIKLKRMLLEG